LKLPCRRGAHRSLQQRTPHLVGISQCAEGLAKNHYGGSVAQVDLSTSLNALRIFCSGSGCVPKQNRSSRRPWGGALLESCFGASLVLCLCLRTAAARSKSKSSALDPLSLALLGDLIEEHPHVPHRHSTASAAATLSWPVKVNKATSSTTHGLGNESRTWSKRTHK